jgi:recombination protein RecA
VKVAKNKVAPPFRIAEFDIIFGKGISTVGCLVDLAEETGVILRRGAWYSYEGNNLAQGRDNTVKYVEENAEFGAKIQQQVLDKLNTGTPVSANSLKQAEEDVEDDDDGEGDGEE